MAGTYGGGSSSESETLNIAQTIEASENAVVLANRNSDKNKGNIRLSGKSTLQIYNSSGPSAEQLTQSLSGVGNSISASIAAALASAQDRDSGVQDAIEDRIRLQVAAGGETAAREASGSLGFSNYVLLAAGAFVLLLAVWLKRKK